MSFNAFPETYRGTSCRSDVHRGVKPSSWRRDASTDGGLSISNVEFPFLDDDAVQHKDVEVPPPELPYSWEVCSSNTFTCSDSKISPQILRENIMGIVRKVPADITTGNSLWEFNGVIYPQELKTVFKVAFFNNAAEKNSCIVEMQLQEGDRVAFQGLCSYVKAQAGLVYAFAEEWGFGDDDDDDELDANEWEGGYQHRSLAPLPLPSALLSELDSISIDDEEFSPFNADSLRGSGNSLAEMLLENTCSPFADVRNSGWQELAKATNDLSVAEALVAARVNGEDCVTLATAILQQGATCDITADTQRCVLKTLLNITRNGVPAVCRKIIINLKTQIINFASASASVETRAIVVQLMQGLVPHMEGSQSKTVEQFGSVIRSIANDSCRASDHARRALKSLNHPVKFISPDGVMGLGALSPTSASARHRFDDKSLSIT